MKTNSPETHSKFWMSAGIGLALLVVAATPQAALAQWTTGTDISNTNSGNVGVGTSTPAYRLDVLVNAQWIARFKKTDATNGGIIIDAAAGYNPNVALAVNGTTKWYLNNNSGNGDALQFWESSGTVPRFTLTQAGNVGIGTTSPTQAQLVVRNNSSTSLGSLDVMNEYGSHLALYNYGSAYVGNNDFGVPAALTVTVESGNQFYVGTYAAQPLIFETNGAERMRILSSGNVGIGTTSPRTTLHITSGASGVLPYNSGSDITVGTLESSANGYLSILTPSANQSGVLFGNVASNVAGGIVYNNTATANGLQFRTNGNNTRMVIDSSGNVGIGTTNPSYKLEVAGEIRSTTIGGVGGFRFPDGTLQVTAALGGTITAVTGGAGLTGSGTSGPVTLNVGAGTGVSVAAHSISVNYGSASGTAVEGNKPITITTDVSSGLTGGAALALGSGPSFTLVNTDKGSSQSIFKNVANDLGQTQFSAGSSNNINNNDTIRFAGSGGTTIAFNSGTKQVTIDSSGITSSQWTPAGTNNINYAASGNVGVGTATPASKLDVTGNGHFTGNLTVDGNIAAKYQDMAEWVPSSEQIPTGTVVVLDSTRSNQVVSSTQAYDTRVAGVVSEQPGIALGESGAGKVLVATTGRVLVNVDASRCSIHIGDLLVTSDVPGVAMKSEPVNVGGVQLHRPGTLIGKALEPLEKGKSKILVLLSLQ